jgi:hypothetical protein
MSTHATTRALCLCCGTRYDPDEWCPRFDERPHTFERALAVSAYLRAHDVFNPRPLDVRHALDALDARGRA